MKKQWKRLAALSSAAVMAVGTLLYFPTDTLQNISWGITASAEETGTVTWTQTEGDNLVWTLYDNGTLTISGEGEMKDYSWSANSPATQKKDNVKKVVIEDGITSIGNRAFSDCTGLESIEIPSGVTSIGVNAFQGCRNLASIEIPNSVTNIGISAFRRCTRLSSITIPSSVTSIGDYAFYDTSWLTNKRQENDSLVIVNEILIDGAACSGEVTIPDGVTNIGNHAFESCNKLASITIPSSVTNIGKYAFSDCNNLASIKIPEGVTSIGDGAFYKCTGLTSINIPEGVTSIGDYVFESCNKLASITIPSSVTSIGAGVFNHCSSLNEVLLENGSKLTSGQLGVNESIIGTYWNEDNLTWTLTADGTMTISGSGAMKDYDNDNSPATQKKDNVKKVVIEDEITSIGNYAFSDCSNLASIEIPEGVTSIGNFAFGYCSGLTSITIPDSVTSIGEWAFYKCTGLTSITIPKSVTSIGNFAFYGCSNLASITIPKSVTSIGNNTFYGCGELTVYLEEGSKLTSGQLGVDANKISSYQSWTEGDLTWALTADGTMTISGKGAMKDYSWSASSPATQKKASVKKL